MQITAALALPLTSIWEESHKTIMGRWVFINLSSILDALAATLRLTDSATLALRHQLLSFTPAHPGRTTILEEVVGIIIIIHPPVVMGEVFIL